MATVIIAKNQTAGDLPLRFLAAPDAKIPASGQVTLTDYNTVTEIQESPQLLSYITNDQVLFNLNGEDLTKAQSLWVRESVTPKYNNNALTPPTANDDEDDGYSKGSIWIDTVEKRTYVCVQDTAGSAEWWVYGSSPGEVAERSGVEMAFFTSATPYLEINTTTPRVIVSFVFPGTHIYKPEKLKAICSRDGTVGNGIVDIYDYTNNNVVVSLTFSSDAFTYYNQGPLVNLPLDESIFQIRAYKDTGAASKTQIHYVGLK